MTDTANVVLVTRPAGQSAPLTAALEAAGYRVEHLPALDIVPLGADEIRGAYTPEPAADFAIFVSTNAVRHGFDALALDPATRLVAIGRATADALREKGAESVIENPGVRSEDLLTVPEFQGDLGGQRFLIVRGDDGRDILRDTLSERGARVDVIDVYRREIPDVPPVEVERVGAALDERRYAAVVAMSLASHANLETLLGTERLAGVAVLTPSPGVADRRRELGDDLVTLLADGPDPESLVAAMATPARPDTQLSEAASDEPEPAASADGTGDGVQPARGRSGLTTGAALAMSLLALVLSGYTLWQQQGIAGAPAPAAPAPSVEPVEAPPPAPAAPAYDPTDDIAALRRALVAAEQASGANRAALDSLKTAQNSLRSELGRLVRQADSERDLVESLPGRVENVEQSVAAMQGIAAGSRTDWLLAEAEYYMQLANAQLQLARNPTLASYALELADQRVRELADPAYTPVRRALADEMRALAAVSQSDLEGVALSLSSLAESVDSLPLANTITSQIESLPDDSGGDGEPTGEEGNLDRLWRLTKEQVAKGFRVRKLDESLTPLLSPEATYFLRTNLTLKFDTARLALLRGEQDAFDSSLADASAWIAEYFDTDNAAVADALVTIERLAQTEIQTAYPDISGSLTILRRTRSLADGGDDAAGP